MVNIFKFIKTQQQHHKQASASGTLLEDPKLNRRMIEKLMYLFVTIPSLSYSVHILS